MKDCIFCKIVDGQIPSAQIWEDEKHLAFLSVEPHVEGMTIVIPKDHFDSRVMEMPESDYLNLLEAAREVSRILKEGLDKDRVFLVIEGMEVNHAHIKLYPVNEDNNPLLGEVLSKKSERSDQEELKKVLSKINI